MSTVIQARVGREKQRYEDKFRLVAGVIPYRRKPDQDEKNIHSTGPDIFDGLEILMISTPKRDDLVFPKGGWENDETVEEAACREALEEAGVRGIISERRLGIWELRSKSKQNCEEGACRGYMFALEVTEQLESYPEQSTHHRRWVSVSEAWELCRYEWMKEALESFVIQYAAKPFLHIAEIISDQHSAPLFCLPKMTSEGGERNIVDSAINTLC